MADLPYFLDEPSSQEEQAALAAALRKQQALGLIGQLTGDRAMGGVGQQLVSGAQHGQQLLAQAKDRALARGLEAKKDQETQQYRADTLAERVREAKERGLDRGLQREFLRDQQAARLAAMKEAAGAKAAAASQNPKVMEQILGPLGKDLDPTQGRSNLSAQAQKSIMAAERLETLLGAPGPMTKQRLEEAVIMAATIASGGNQPTESQVKGMYPETYRGNIENFLQKVTNNPRDIEAAPFLEQLKQQSEREKATANAQIKRTMLNRLVHHPAAFQLYPEQAQRMAEGAGLKGLYNPETLLPTQEVDPVKAAVPPEAAKKPVKYLVRPDGKVRVPIYLDEKGKEVKGAEEPVP